jgi:hypothetical protein
MQSKEEISVNIMPIMLLIILAVAIAVIASTLTEFGKLSIAQGQGNDNTTLQLTPEQRSAMCDPNNPLSMLKSVNTTESKVCGIPKTQPSNATTSEGIAPAETPLEPPEEG